MLFSPIRTVTKGTRATLWMPFLALVALGASRTALALPPADPVENGFSVYERLVQYGYPATAGAVFPCRRRRLSAANGPAGGIQMGEAPRALCG